VNKSRCATRWSKIDAIGGQWLYEGLKQREAKMVRYGLHTGQDSMGFAVK
jgi:hypothetical protein